MLNLDNKIDMRLDQYDKLEQNIKKSVKYILDLKSENIRLKKEVEQLRKQLDNTSERGIKKLNNRNIENTVRDTFPKEKTETIVSQLDEVLKKMKNFTTGVEF
jgi:predicted RNase H-like nuclease (RuvC/YqgF family)